ncbi:MAG: DUF4374 domain-containing protein [Prevotellaceae bacterium]|nr:DUF4374 domain-containing protein [Prevotellaceae bacterium]
MRKNLALSSLAAATLFAASCDKNDDNNSVVEEPKGSFVVVATSGEASYLLQADDLTSGEMTIVNSGLETDNGTEWEFNSNKYLYCLVYNQGNAGLTSSYVLNADGQIEKRGIENEVRSRFTTHGSYGKYVVTAAAVATDTKDAAGNAAQGVTFTYIDAETQTLATKTIITENILGNGEYATFSGISEANGKLYTAGCPIGVSAYGAAKGAADTARTTTAYPDSVWIAVFDNTNFENPRIIRDGRLSYATTRFRSQFYTNLAVDDRQNLYVFSCAYESTTTKPSGVLRIKSGTEAFDPDFFFDIEAASGGHKLCRPFYIAGDYFLLQMYTEPGAPKATSSAPAAVKLAIFDAANKTFRWVTGLPDVANIGSLSKKTAADNGKIHIAVVTADGEQPAIYTIDPATAAGTKGMAVTCTGIAALGKLIPVQ